MHNNWGGEKRGERQTRVFTPSLPPSPPFCRAFNLPPISPLSVTVPHSLTSGIKGKAVNIEQEGKKIVIQNIHSEFLKSLYSEREENIWQRLTTSLVEKILRQTNWLVEDFETDEEARSSSRRRCCDRPSTLCFVGFPAHYSHNH